MQDNIEEDVVLNVQSRDILEFKKRNRHNNGGFYLEFRDNFVLKYGRIYSIMYMVIKMNIKAVILDLDGTLLDTITDIRNSLNEALQIEGFDVQYTDQDVKYFIGS